MRSVAGWPSSGSRWVKSVNAGTLAHASSSSRPSTVTGAGARAASTAGAGVGSGRGARAAPAGAAPRSERQGEREDRPGGHTSL